MPTTLELIPLADFPLVEPGQNVAQLIAACLEKNGLALMEGDVLIVAQKIISKAEDRYVRLADVEPSPAALALAEQADKDPRQMELVLRESQEIVKVRPGVVIVEHRNGYVHANAGIDKSNIPARDNDPQVLLLPKNPDGSAQILLETLSRYSGIGVKIIINDSFGRAWRNGTVGVAIGTAGFQPLYNQVGEKDLYGNILEVTESAVADELAAAASLVMGQAAEACPVVLARGLTLQAAETGSHSLIRAKSQDMFR
ncbi:MAG: coenzyme F420-0:L-glutamate ligase [Proteobacteria bacterium]|nr:coenzyme F420-0:L-glutamate ligase [Pseudomonadota bacterium]